MLIHYECGLVYGNIFREYFFKLLGKTDAKFIVFWLNKDLGVYEDLIITLLGFGITTICTSLNVLRVWSKKNL